MKTILTILTLCLLVAPAMAQQANDAPVQMTAGFKFIEGECS